MCPEYDFQQRSDTFGISGYSPVFPFPADLALGNVVAGFASNPIPAAPYLVTGDRPLEIQPPAQAELFLQRDGAISELVKSRGGTDNQTVAQSCTHTSIQIHHDSVFERSSIGNQGMSVGTTCESYERSALEPENRLASETYNIAHGLHVRFTELVDCSVDASQPPSFSSWPGNSSRVVDPEVTVSSESTSTTLAVQASPTRSDVSKSLYVVVKSILWPKSGKQRHAAPTVGLRVHPKEVYRFMVDEESVSRAARLISKVADWQQEFDRKNGIKSSDSDLQKQLELLVLNEYLGKWEMKRSFKGSVRGSRTSHQRFRWNENQRQRLRRKKREVSVLLSALDTCIQEMTPPEAASTPEERDSLKDVKLLQDTSKALSLLMSVMEASKPWKSPVTTGL